MANATLIGTTGGQVNPILMTGALVNGAMQGVNTLGEGRREIAKTENEREYRNRLLNDEREAAMKSRLREGQLMFEQTQAQLQTKSENEIRNAARVRGIPDADTAPLESLRTAVADYDVKQSITLKASMLQQSIGAARNLPGYAQLKAMRDKKLMERDQLLAQTVLPEPVFNPEMTPQERGAMYQMMADSPKIQMALSSVKDGPKRLAALRAGDITGAVQGLDATTSAEISMLWSGEADNIEKSLQAGKYSKYSSALQQYVAKLRALPQMLSAVDRDLDQLYTIGDKEGLNVGMALRMEDPNDYGPNPTTMPNPETEPTVPSLLPLPAAVYDQPQAPAAPSERVVGVIPAAAGWVGQNVVAPVANFGADVTGGIGKVWELGRLGLIGGTPSPELESWLFRNVQNLSGIGLPEDVSRRPSQYPFSTGIVGNPLSVDPLSANTLSLGPTGIR